MYSVYPRVSDSEGVLVTPQPVWCLKYCGIGPMSYQPKLFHDNQENNILGTFFHGRDGLLHASKVQHLMHCQFPWTKESG